MADIRIPTTGGSTTRCTRRKAGAKDSLDLDDDDRAAIRSAVEGEAEARTLITHGTDTMVTTAEALRGIGGKVVVLTGAMQPASIRDSDAAFNLGLAVGAARLAAPGVYLAMSGRLFPAETVQKDRDAGVFREVDAEPPAADRP
ncbi:asparaginase domain-containing protein [uncultured Amnibacterium sp.]|uniref:asparaginase domain-containing protein n=1 Tax=uncultured Amnibacterium sp. TaxID=1631851 RepID=UPI0035CA2C72